MADVLAMSGNTPNYSGMLFNKGNTKTPFSTMIGAHRKTTNHTEFVTGQEYETAEGSQPEISEAESLTAPDASVVKREQKTNVTQIFQEKIGNRSAVVNNQQIVDSVSNGVSRANDETNSLLRTIIEYQELLLKKETSVNMDGKRMDKQISKARRNTGFSFSPT